MSRSDGTSVEPLIREALHALVAIDFDRYMAMWHDDCRVEYPTQLPGRPANIVGKERLAEYNRGAFHGTDRREIRDLEIRPFADPSFALVEFELVQSFGGGAGHFQGRVCIIFGEREGKLSSMREYADTRLLVEAIATYESAVTKSARSVDPAVGNSAGKEY